MFVKREMIAELLRDLEDTLPVAEAFAITWRNFCRYATKNPVRFAFTEQFANSPLVEGCRAESLDSFKPLVDSFERGRREKVFKNIPLEIFVAFTFVPLTGLIKEQLSGAVVLNRKALATTFEIAWDAATS